MKKKEVYVGIDVSKGYSDFSIVTSEKEQIESVFQLDDSKDGHKILKEKVLELLKKYTSVIVGVENTGGYERNWVNTMNWFRKKNKSVHIYKLNPKAVKHQIQTLMKTVVDDGVSAYGIAIYMINHHQIKSSDWEKSSSKPEKITEQQLLHSMIQSLIKHRTAKLNQLEKLIYSAFPEVLKYVKDSFPQWVLLLLEKYPSAKAVRNAKISGIVKIRWVSVNKAQEIKKLAKESIGSLQSVVNQMIVSQYCKDIMSLNTEIDKYKAVLVNLYKKNPQITLLTSTRGVAEWTAVSFLIELGDFKRFKTVDQLASFFGVHPSFKQSGDGLFKVKMSKQGSSKMRAILYLIAHNLVMHNPYFKSLYAKYKAKGKKKRVVMGILMHKVLRVFWGMLKNNKPFDEDTDRKNQEKQPEKVEQIHGISKKARRYQPISLDAPVSRSNTKKRKAILSPQSSTLDESHEVCENSHMQT